MSHEIKADKSKDGGGEEREFFWGNPHIITLTSHSHAVYGGPKLTTCSKWLSDI